MAAAPLSPMAFALVALGSGLGGALRYGVGQLSRRALAGLAAPWPALAGTAAVNLLGSALLMAALVRAERGGALAAEPLRLLLLTGALGGFTTYSTFNAEVLGLWGQGRALAAAGYLLATVGGCLLGGWLGALASPG
jgi:CrcB protein